MEAQHLPIRAGCSKVHKLSRELTSGHGHQPCVDVKGKHVHVMPASHISNLHSNTHAANDVLVNKRLLAHNKMNYCKLVLSYASRL